MRYTAIVVFCLALVASLSAQEKAVPAFPLGESVRFKIYYGWFALGEAYISVGDELVDGQYYDSQIGARTIGLFSWLAGIDNSYSGHVNIADYKTIESEKHLDERKGKYDQWNIFDYDKMVTKVKIKDHSKSNPDKTIQVDLTPDTYDLHGTYMFLRSKLWSGLKKGEAIHLKTYWEDKLYAFGMEYGGTERIKYDGDKYRTHKFYALFPVSRTFPKEKAVTFYLLEQDGMAIPLLIEADLKIGKVRCELQEYKVKDKEILASK